MGVLEYYEDFKEGFRIDYSVPGLTTQEIISFAEQFDPQRFHLDEQEAAKTHFGGLVASGFQTQLLCFRGFCDRVLLDSKAVGAPGIDRLQWIRPWFPGETLDVTVRLVDRRRSAKRKDRGYIGFELLASVNGEMTMKMEWTVIILTKNEV